MLRYWTAGESHGRGLLALVDGFPAGVTIDAEAIDSELRRRQGGYGRGDRQAIETDAVEVHTGVWNDVTLGSPIALLVMNRDYKLPGLEELDAPRPGHGDLAGSIKYLGTMRAILERASARESPARVAAGALAQQLLAEFDITSFGYVLELGGHKIEPPEGMIEELRTLRDASDIYSLDPENDGPAKKIIDQAIRDGDTVGGIIEIRVTGLPIGLGTHAMWDRKLDGRLAQAVMAVQAIKGVEIGLGFESARRPGSKMHDAIQFDPAKRQTRSLGYKRKTNNAGGLEAGMTNGQTLVVRAAMKPISTLKEPLDSVDIKTKEPSKAAYERSDVCAVSAASVIIENVVAFEIATAMIDKFGGDSLQEMKARWELYHRLAREHA